MTSLADLKQATEAAFDAANEFDTAVNADLSLLDATEKLLYAVRGLRKDRKLRRPCEEAIVEYEEQLASLMEKYAVELVPNAMYVGKFDLQVIGSAAECGKASNTCAFPSMQDMDASPASQHLRDLNKVLDDANEQVKECCGVRAAAGAWQPGQKNWLPRNHAGTPFKPGCI